MNDDPFWEPVSPRRRIGLLVVILVMGGAVLWGAWYVATKAQAAKRARVEKTQPAQTGVPEKTELAPPPEVTPPPSPPAPPVSMPQAETAPPPTPVTSVPKVEVVVPAVDPAGKLVEARELFKNDRCLQARDICIQVLGKSSSAAAEALLGEINVTMAFSRRPMPEKTDYTVQVGDTLAGLAKKFTTTKEMIRQSNNFTGDVIRVGDRLRILGAQWSVEVNKNRNDLVIKMNDKFFKRYRVGTGQYSMTPTGTFHVVTRIEHPTWYHAGGAPISYGDTNNVLGTHWISLDIPHYGIHGTWDTNTIGQQSSQGCIRLLNGEVEELYILLPEGTPIAITE